jgi:hypothetical protein
MREVRPYDNEDARRDLAVELFKQHVRQAGITDNYEADIEYMENAIVAFGDHWASLDLTPETVASLLLDSTNHDTERSDA